MSFYAPFTLPFIVGAIFMLVVLVWKYLSWFLGMPREKRLTVLRKIPSMATLRSVWEVIRECLLHVRIFKVDWRLGYMHASLAFGWFLLIAVGSLETIAYLGMEMVPLQGHVFFKFFAVQNNITEHKPLMDFVMDFLLAVVLSGVLLAWFKRLHSRPSIYLATGWLSRSCGLSFRCACLPRALLRASMAVAVSLRARAEICSNIFLVAHFSATPICRCGGATR